jgi:predicted nucleotidyltransferase
MCNQTTLHKITSRVIRAAKDNLGEKLDKVILYGSYARGDCDDESDIDIMVLADIPHAEASRISSEINEAVGDFGLEYGFLVSIHVTDSVTFYRFIDDLPFYMNVAREGVVLRA